MKQRELDYVVRRIRDIARSNSNNKVSDPGGTLSGIRKALLEGRQMTLKPLSQIKRSAVDGLTRYSGCDAVKVVDVFEVPESHKKDLKAFEDAKKKSGARNKKISNIEEEFIDDVMCGLRNGREAISDFKTAISKF